MCLTPVRLDDETVVACRGCAVCRSNRVNDLVGRCVAEQVKSSSSLALTLTYAGDVPEAAILQYSDVQKFLKRLRWAGYRVRYICAGEYGSAKGRAHWHIVLFFSGEAPTLTLDRRIDWHFWPHGFVYAQQPDYNGFRYLLKYVLKMLSQDVSVRRVAMSKKPPLGYDYFMQLAEDYVDQGLAIHAPEYSFKHVTDTKGKRRRFWLQGRMRELFLDRYCDLWKDRYGKEPPETDWLLERYLDPKAAREMELERMREWSMISQDNEEEAHEAAQHQDSFTAAVDYAAHPAD